MIIVVALYKVILLVHADGQRDERECGEIANEIAKRDICGNVDGFCAMYEGVASSRGRKSI